MWRYKHDGKLYKFSDLTRFELLIKYSAPTWCLADIFLYGCVVFIVSGTKDIEGILGPR